VEVNAGSCEVLREASSSGRKAESKVIDDRIIHDQQLATSQPLRAGSVSRRWLYAP
jgi:hypothetical protein